MMSHVGSAMLSLVLLSSGAHAQASQPNIPCNTICTLGPEITNVNSPAAVIAQCFMKITTPEQSRNLANAFRSGLGVGKKTNLFALNNANTVSCPMQNQSVFGVSEESYSLPLYGSILQATIVEQIGPPANPPGVASVIVSFMPTNALVFTSPMSLK